jgi:arsenate reductase
MAEGFARHFAHNGIEIYSAGTLPKEIHPLAVRVMKEAGIDISGQRAKGIEAIPIETIDLLITLCGEADESCPALTAKVERQHWPLPDPALARGDEEEQLKIFREVRDQVRRRVEYLLLDNKGSSTTAHEAPHFAPPTTLH